jgi:hypothetical protein
MAVSTSDPPSRKQSVSSNRRGTSRVSTIKRLRGRNTPAANCSCSKREVTSSEVMRDEAERDLLSCAAADRPARGVSTRVGDVRVEAGRAVEAVTARERDC